MFFVPRSQSLLWVPDPLWCSPDLPWWSSALSAPLWRSLALSTPHWWAPALSAPPWQSSALSAPPWWAPAPSSPPWWAPALSSPPWWAPVSSAPPWWAPGPLTPPRLPARPALPQSPFSPLPHGPGPPSLPLFRLCSTTLLDAVGASGSPWKCYVTNPVHALPFTHHQRSPAHHMDSCTASHYCCTSPSNYISHHPSHRSHSCHRLLIALITAETH
ncbi:uncharacterized protein LOC131521586 [Onychostoma macrolepis]|uniref:uncharacterized protein LOC131521586 n=1 Tax=Onychostoma macrolepis TaxID=369639 RepID=UPI002729C918|nr:uncharacterized protein LOC131521586 [Onychostoma macrolepis]